MKCSNRLFVARKPMFVGSNAFLSSIKRRYGVKKAGFSGTLDPFACGVLIIAFGQYTKLFRFLKKSPKTYRATLWLGALSETLDIEGIKEIEEVAPFTKERIRDTLLSFKGNFTYTPPRFSAKKVAGVRAYDLARNDKEVVLPIITSEILDIRLLHYRHPFVTFEADVSEGTYIRSLGEAIAEKLACRGALSHLERLREGHFRFQQEKALNPLEYLDPPQNRYLGNPDDLTLGKKLRADSFETNAPGRYSVVFDQYFAIIEIEKSGKVNYLLNKVKLCSY
ncbi:tRNA pseudouridine(55) synthase TruB [Hydrogenimonas urashimensis]|uniref:tRNA pseudouridine(55) synthase TruB n=1 Tax=Hydrogenimonas urashimensis TaxID=2740515 RepID=UPI00191537CB|nr:tRNA pseudouridine(55) synthase TruB [Hydrogenimonas urashimensis]